MGSAVLGEAISAIREWSTSEGKGATPGSAESVRQSGVQRHGAAGALAEAGVSGAAPDDHARRTARRSRSPTPSRRR